VDTDVDPGADVPSFVTPGSRNARVLLDMMILTAADPDEVRERAELSGSPDVWLDGGNVPVAVGTFGDEGLPLDDESESEGDGEEE